MMDGSKAAVMRVFLGSILCVVVPSGCGEVVELEPIPDPVRHNFLRFKKPLRFWDAQRRVVISISMVTSRSVPYRKARPPWKKSTCLQRPS